MALLSDFQKEKGRYIKGKTPMPEEMAKHKKEGTHHGKAEKMQIYETMVLQEKQENVDLVKWLKPSNEPIRKGVRKDKAVVAGEI